MAAMDTPNRALCFLTSSQALHDFPETFGSHPAIAGRATGAMVQPGPGTLLVPMPSGAVTAMIVNKPMPPGVVKDDFAQTMAWQGWKAAQPQWRSHVIISSLSASAELGQARRIVQDVFLAARVLADALPVDGVYWAGSDLLLPAQAFGAALERHALPPTVLIRCNWSKTGGAGQAGLCARTVGLSFFGLPEVVDETGGADATVIYDRLLNFANYLLGTGAVVGDGETVGNGQGGVRVHHQRDPGGGLVLVLRPVEGAAAWQR